MLEDFMNDDFNDFDEDDMIGNPEESMETWEMQQHEDTCGLQTQGYIIEEVTGGELTEEELIEQAKEQGWYEEGEGTTLEDLGNLLEFNGIDIERDFDNTIEDLKDELESGEHVIVAVDSSEIWNSGADALIDKVIDSVSGVEGEDADHAVEVIGIKENGDGEEVVILNDPGHPDGQGMEVPMDKFRDAWEDSSNYMVNTTDDSEAVVLNSEDHEDSPFDIPVGGYYNNDGTYHWTSDGANTDEDGNILYYS